MRRIDADALIDELSLVYDIGEAEDYPYNIGVMAAIAKVKQMPTIEPKKGRWKDAWMDRQCSLCGIFVAREIAREANFCPNCGARMKRSEDEGPDEHI